MVAFINNHREAYGVESICRVVPIAPSTYYRHRARHLDPTRRSARAMRDEVLKAIIQRIWREHDQAYGFRKVWKQMGPGRSPGSALPRAASDARTRSGRCRAGTGVDHDDAARYRG